MVFVGGSVDCMGWVDIMRYVAWPLSGQPSDHASYRCCVSCSLLFVVLWLALVVFFMRQTACGCCRNSGGNIGFGGG